MTQLFADGLAYCSRAFEATVLIQARSEWSLPNSEVQISQGLVHNWGISAGNPCWSFVEWSWVQSDHHLLARKVGSSWKCTNSLKSLNTNNSVLSCLQILPDNSVGNQRRHTVKSSSWEITAPNINFPSLFLMSYICQSLLSNWERQHLLTLACSFCINMNLSGFTISVFLSLLKKKTPLIYIFVWANSLTLVGECLLSSVAMGTLFIHMFQCRTVHLEPLNLLITLLSHVLAPYFLAEPIKWHRRGRSRCLRRGICNFKSSLVLVSFRNVKLSAPAPISPSRGEKRQFVSFLPSSCKQLSQWR